MDFTIYAISNNLRWILLLARYLQFDLDKKFFIFENLKCSHIIANHAIHFLPDLTQEGIRKVIFWSENLFLEVLNYVKVLEYIDKLSRRRGKREITEDVILKIHKINTKGILDTWKSGHYRKVSVAVVDGYGHIVFQPPKTKDVPKLMSEFTGWLNNKETTGIYPVLEAGIAHYEFVRIHPFVDGNGRTARALATLILYLRGFDTKRFFALDDYYNEDKSRYYAALQTVDPKTVDITKWLEYFIEGVAVSMAKVKKTILDFSFDKRLKDKRGQIFLNDRQMSVLKYLQTNPRITNRECRKLTGLSDEGVRKDLKFLIHNELIQAKGAGRGAHYVLVGD